MDSISFKIKQYLDRSRIRYRTGDSWSTESFGDDDVLTAGAIDEVVRSLLVKIAGEPALVTVGSNEELDLEEMRRVVNGRSVDLMEDDECHRLFAECDVTALPALGSVLGLPVYCSRHVLNAKQICFNSGTHDEIIQLATTDFIRLAKPVVGDFAHSAAFSTQAGYYW